MTNKQKNGHKQANSAFIMPARYVGARLDSVTNITIRKTTVFCCLCVCFIFTIAAMFMMKYVSCTFVRSRNLPLLFPEQTKDVDQENKHRGLISLQNLHAICHCHCVTFVAH